MKTQQLLYLLFLFAPVASWGQYLTSNTLALTVYANITLEDQEREFFNLTNGQTSDKGEAIPSLQFGHFSPALCIFHANDHLSEIELTFLRFDKEDVVRVTELSGPFPGTTRTFSLGIRYAYSFNLQARRKSRVRSYFGLSVLPYVHSIKGIPEIKALYSTTQTDLGLLTQVISRLIVELSDFVYLDLNAPISILDVRQQTMRLQDGGQNLPDIKESKTDLRWLPKKTHLRVGLGVVF